MEYIEREREREREREEVVSTPSTADATPKSGSSQCSKNILSGNALRGATTPSHSSFVSESPGHVVRVPRSPLTVAPWQSCFCGYLYSLSELR